MTTRILPPALALLTGLFLGTSYIPFYPWALFVVWVPLWFCWLKKPTYKNVLLTGLLSTLTFNLIGFHWIAFTAREFGHLPWVISILVLVIFSLFSALHVPLTGLLWIKLNKRFQFTLNESLFVIAVTYWVLETLWPMIFPWNMGYPWLWAQWPGMQWADVIGFQGLSLLTVLLNSLILWVFVSPILQRKRLTVFSGAVFVFILFHITGHFRGQSLPPSDKSLKVLAVQANIGNLEKAYAEKGMAYQDHIITQYFQLTEEALKTYPKPDLIAYPETALPIALNREYSATPYNMKTAKFLEKVGLPLLTGSYSEPMPDKKTYNSVFLLNSKLEILGYYDKTLLLAFGEYIPGGERFPILYEWMPFISHFSFGTGPQVISWNDLNFGIQVCYEGLYPWFTTQLVNKKAQIIFNATNDSWFGEAFEPQQHLYMTAARAIEYRRPLLRITNTGISTAVLPDGRFLEQSPVYQKWFGLLEIPYTQQPLMTVYSRLEPYLVYLVLFLSLGILALNRRKPRA